VQASVAGAQGAIVAFLVILVATIVLRKWRSKQPGTPGTVLGALNAGALFGVSAVVFYFTPNAFNTVDLTSIFIISGVVGVSSYLLLYDWKLPQIHPLRSRDLKMEDLKFVHEDAIELLHLITWASIIFLTGTVVAALTTYVQHFNVGTRQAAASGSVLMLFISHLIYVGIGIWWGWMTPILYRLEQVRMELRAIDQ
jgi:hypothetical protein